MSEAGGDWSGTFAGITGALVALIYGAMRLLKRSRCASHTKCCDIDVARSTTERKKDPDLEMIILKILKKNHLGEALAGKGDEKLKVVKVEKGEELRTV